MKNYNQPNTLGRFGDYGGMYVSETLMPLLIDLDQSYQKIQKDKKFQKELKDLFKNYVGRPSALHHAKNLSAYINGPKVYFKRDELNHTGAHKINNCLGQILLAKKMGKTRIIAETGAGQHGVATATVCALFGLPCIVYMGEKDIERQSPNVFRMKLLGAEIRSVSTGSKSLKDAMNEALRDWVTNVEDTFYIIGTAAGPHPYPAMVRDFQSIIGKEVRGQLEELEGRSPDVLMACIGGGSNALGLFHEFLDDSSVKMIAVEAAGHGINTNKHAASLTGGKPGVLHGNKTYLLQSKSGQIQEAHSISAGLDYPGVGPEHSYLNDIKRVEYKSVNDFEAVKALQYFSEKEGIIAALETSHALFYAMKVAKTMKKNQSIIVNLSGRGDKDLESVNAFIKKNRSN